MLLALGGLAGLAAGLLTGGRLRNLLERSLRWPLVVIAVLAVRELEIRTPFGAARVAPAAFALTLAVLLAWAAWHYDRLPGIWLVAAGIAMNLLVTLVNGAHMPVARSVAHLGPPELLEQGTFAQYEVAGTGTHLAWLGDWIILPPPIGVIFHQAYSPGDLVSMAGLALVLFLSTRPARKTGSSKVITTP